MRNRVINKILACVLAATIVFETGYVCYATEDDTTTVDTTATSSQVDNSIAMLNYLTVVTQEINASSNSRLFLEEAYSSLINNTSPNAIDKRTKTQLNDMLDTIDAYRMVDVKRERLQYIYEQNQAQALREAVPNPLGLLASVQSFNLRSLVTSIVYMAIDSKASYDTAMAQADMQYLQDGWELDDAETNALTESREQLFNYMIDIVHTYNIPDKDALSEEAVNEFVKCKNNTNVARRIQFLESNKKKYENFGEYWLLCAKSYYEDGDYQSCLDAIEKYDSMEINIFRKDHNYADVLPLAIASSEEVYGAKPICEEKIRYYVEQLTNNLETEDWSLRYFAAQTYLELYTKSKNKADIQTAYKLTEDNVNYLIDEQNTKNSVYLNPVVKKDVPKNLSSAKQKEIKQYNKMLEETRKKELPPVYEPLYLNCDLLFALADELSLDKSAKSRMEKILHGGDIPLFLTTPLDNTYYFTNTADEQSYEFSFDKGELILPASILSDRSKIVVSITDGKNMTTIDDWKIDKVKRGTEKDISTFKATYKSEKAKKYKYIEGTTIDITVVPVEGSSCEEVEAQFVAHEKKFVVIPTIEFERTK
ncbi:hypothetical protein [Butyrivibrio sp. WCD3002]|uniref:hypothetical protein n=1 Tax=Butyrivibrio sp. WCD3002 TaxID=1280676 RepID=UPI000425D2EA|nr:hypothetical protein [Butyrivibrio sp. WCD3002]